MHNIHTENRRNPRANYLLQQDKPTLVPIGAECLIIPYRKRFEANSLSVTKSRGPRQSLQPLIKSCHA